MSFETGAERFPQPPPMEWGVKPLPEHAHFAVLVRELTSQVLSLETSSPALVEFLAALERAREQFAAEVPVGIQPRIGAQADSNGRVFIDHCRDIGAFNPMFPIYDIVVHGPGRATGTVNFPVAYEGPAGCVNGGFLAVFFDEIVQHHNCDLGVSGATRDLNVRYRRPTPLLVDLQFEIGREVREPAVYSEARILQDGQVLCSVTTSAVWVEREVPDVSGRRAR